jgi:hypothetical protein
MASGATPSKAFNETLQFITTVKLAELEKQVRSQSLCRSAANSSYISERPIIDMREP